MQNKQLKFHIPGEWCDTWIDEPACEDCDRRFHMVETRVMNDCLVWAWILFGEDSDMGSAFYEIAPWDMLSDVWMKVE